MAFTTNAETYIGITDDGQIELRKTKVVLEDGVEIARRHSREVLTPGQDVSSYGARVRNVAAAVWTQAVINAWNTKHPTPQTP